jgi:hypothetical protein
MTPLSGDKGYDTRGFVEASRALNATPHVAHNTGRSGGSAIDARTTCFASPSCSPSCRLDLNPTLRRS